MYRLRSITRPCVAGGLILLSLGGCGEDYDGPPLPEVAATCDASTADEDRTLILSGWDQVHCALGELKTPESVAQQIKNAPVGSTGQAEGKGLAYAWAMGTLLGTSASNPDLTVTLE